MVGSILSCLQNAFTYKTTQEKKNKKLMINRLELLNNKIEYDWLNENLNSFKIKCKKLFLIN